MDVIIPSTYNTLFLYAFLGWGLLIALMYGVKEKIFVPFNEEETTKIKNSIKVIKDAIDNI